MPPLIKPRRAAVSEDAIKWAIAYWKTADKKMKEEIRTAPTSMQPYIESKYKPALERIDRVLTNERAMDEEISHIRALPFLSLDILVDINWNDKKTVFLVAHTRRVILEGSEGKFDMGMYTIYVPNDIVTSGVGSHSLHFVPDRAPLVYGRHPHHTAHNLIGGNEKPWRMSSSTCWGGFSGIMQNINREGDLVGLLRNCAIYLTRHNPGSPLAHLRNMDWAVKLNATEAKELANA